MKKISLYTLIACWVVLLTACDDVNFGKFFYTDCDVNARFEQSIAYHQQHPIDTLTVEQDDYSFWVTSDLHIENELSQPVQDFLTLAGKGKELFIVYNGDLYNGKEEYANYTATVLKEKSPLPAFYVAGNHDLYFGWNLYQTRFGTSTYTSVVKTPSGKDLFIFLESASATLGANQYEWLSQVLSKRGYYRHCFVFTHTNLLSQHIANGTFLSDEAQMLFSLFSKNRVNAVFTGHAHHESDQTIMGVRYLITGALKNGYFGKTTVSKKGFEWEFKQL